MKTKWIFLISLILILLGLILFLRDKRLDSLDVNQRFIHNKVFGKDSENRGYSDRAKKYMEEELEVFDNDPIMRIYFDKLLKQERKEVLVKSQSEYIKEITLRSRIRSCLINHYIDTYPDKKFIRWPLVIQYFESDNMKDLTKAVSYEYEPGLTQEEVDDIYRSPTDKECEDIKNGK